MTDDPKPDAAKTARAGQKRGGTATASKRKRVVVAGPPSKLGIIVALLKREGGVSLAELVAATGWQPHSVRGALAGTLRRKGHAVLSEKTAGERRYRIEVVE